MTTPQLTNNPSFVPGLENQITLCEERLMSSGSLHQQTGLIEIDDVRIAIASLVGGQESNRDSIYCYRPASPSRLSWVVAIADGVSRSFASKLGSSLACVASIEHLIADQSTELPIDPVSHASNLFRDIGERLLEMPDQGKPSDVSSSLWSHCVQEGRLFQTTLMVLWQSDDEIHLCGVGDGGFAVDYDANRTPMIFIPRFDGNVDCLGAMTGITKSRFYHRFNDCDRICLFTDGLSPAILSDYVAALKLWRQIPVDGERNEALRVLKLSERTGEVDDNISIAMVSR